MTQSEIRGFNCGVSAMLAIASRSAERIAANTKRNLYTGFAVEALEEMAQAGRDLLIITQEIDKQAGACTHGGRVNTPLFRVCEIPLSA